MKLGLALVVLVGCGCPYTPSSGETADAGPADAPQPTIFCQYTEQACSDAWATSVTVHCTGALNEDSGGCTPMAGEPWTYCCPGGSKDAGPAEAGTCHPIEGTDKVACLPLTCDDLTSAGWSGVAGNCATPDWTCCVVPWLNGTVWTKGCCNAAGYY